MTRFMNKLKQISSVHKHDILVYTIYAVILALLLFVGSAHIHADSFVFPKQQITYLRYYQPKKTNQPRNYRKPVNRLVNNNTTVMHTNRATVQNRINRPVNHRMIYVHKSHKNQRKPYEPAVNSHNHLRVGAIYHNHKVHRHVYKHANDNWFRNGLNHRNFDARSWVAWHESRDRWNIISYGHVCIGYFQLNPNYLGYKHGHVNLNHKHQVKVADRYASNRYGDWVNAKAFWLVHHWY